MSVLTVSTLGAPGESLATVLRWLNDAGASGLELRLGPGQIAHPAMTAAECADVRERVAEAGIRVTGLASYVQVAGAASDELVIGALAGAMQLAALLGAPMVRVFPGAPVRPGPFDRPPELLEPQAEADARAARRLSALARLSEELGVVAALETHDSHPRGADVARILTRVDGPVAAVWDLMHPWRTGEPLDHTWAALDRWLAAGAVQVKDARLPDPTPLPVGAGTLPVDDFAELLIGHRYAGPVCLEWEKAWHPSAENLPVALDSARRWFERHWRR